MATKVGLIKGRHDMPVEIYIVDEEIKNIFDYDLLRKKVTKRIETMKIPDRLEVYVTGLTPVLAEVIVCCQKKGIPLSLMHYNFEIEGYEEQMLW
ncbi:hypothetical protein [Enterococcus cecorum]|uniref:hypothetical protein n=1 Tax=Enterococcus cecorum TaxID=44008 RepID=UPI00200B2D01|nr:hypothetical protein [Enterococcus cecorum]